MLMQVVSTLDDTQVQEFIFQIRDLGINLNRRGIVVKTWNTIQVLIVGFPCSTS